MGDGISYVQHTIRNESWRGNQKHIWMVDWILNASNYVQDLLGCEGWILWVLQGRCYWKSLLGAEGRWKLLWRGRWWNASRGCDLNYCAWNEFLPFFEWYDRIHLLGKWIFGIVCLLWNRNIFLELPGTLLDQGDGCRTIRWYLGLWSSEENQNHLDGCWWN